MRFSIFIGAIMLLLPGCDKAAPQVYAAEPIAKPKPVEDKIAEQTKKVLRFGDVCCLASDKQCHKTYDPEGRGIRCQFSDPCRPTECTQGSPSENTNCDKTLPAPGQCECIDNFCVLHLKSLTSGNSKETGCSKHQDCSLDGPTGTCHLSPEGRRGVIRTEGPTCVCNKTSKTCELVWYDPVPCKTWHDCWYETDPVLHPVKAKKPRSKRVRPCRDGEIDAACVNGACEMLHWAC